MTEITSLQNPRVKAAVRLRDGRHRHRQRRILIDGTRELSRALDAQVRLLEAFVSEPLCTSDESRALLARLDGSGGEVFRVSKPVFEKLAFGGRVEGIVAVAATPEALLADLTLSDNPLIAVLEGVEKPGNVGAVLRSADAAGLDALVVADPQTDLYNPNAIRASLGTIFTMPIAQATAAETLDWLRRWPPTARSDRIHAVLPNPGATKPDESGYYKRGARLAIYAARVDGSRLYTEIDFRLPAAIVLGSEAEGLSSAWQAADVTAIRLPMLGAADSLNVSATAAVLFYEARRQRGGQPGRRA